MKKIFSLFFLIALIFLVGCQSGRKNLSDISDISDKTESKVVIEGLEGGTVRTHFQNIDDNFDELYALTDTTDAGFTGMSADVITSGEIADGRLNSGITRDAEWDTTTEINAATTDEDFLVDSDISSTVESATSNNFDPDRLAGDTVDNDLIDEAICDSALTRDSELASATVASAGELSPAKTSGEAGYSQWFEAEGTSELVVGVQGPDNISTNRSYKFPNENGTVGQVLRIASVTETTTLPGSKTGDLITLENATISGGSGYVATPTYSDDTCVTGTHALDATHLYYCISTDTWDYQIVSGASLVWANWSNPAPVTYSFTLSVVSDGTITIGGTGYTSSGSPHTITGLSGATAITALYGGTNDTLVWSGADSADVTGTYDTYSITMDADKTVSATFSVAGSASIETLRPDSTATVGDFTASATTIYGDTSDQSDATYVACSTYSSTFYVGIANTSASAGRTINSVTIKERIRNTSGTEVPSIRWYGSTGHADPIASVTGDWVEYELVMAVNPETSVAWTSAQIDDMSIGTDTANTANTTQVAECWVEVDYVP